MARTQAPDYEQRRDAIVAVAARLFARTGFAGTSVSDLAAACDMSKSLLYHYYGSKEEILYAVMASHIDQLENELVEATRADRPPRETFEAVIRTFLDSYAGAADRQKVLLNELDSLPADNRKIVVGKQRRIIDVMQRLIVALYPGLADDSVRARAQTMLVFGMINWTHTWMNPGGPLSVSEIADMVLAFVLPRSAAPVGAPASRRSKAWREKRRDQAS